MSYQTTYHLNYDAELPTIDELAAKLAETVRPHIVSESERGEATQAWIDILQGEPTTWYSHQTDLAAITPNWPDQLFVLTGEGEEFPDFWKEYHRNGKVTALQGEVTYPEFQENMLKEPT